MLPLSESPLRMPRTRSSERVGTQKARPDEPTGIQRGYKKYKNAYFAGRGRSVRMSSLVLRHFEQEVQAQIKTEAGRKMALKCEFCGKAPHYGNVISHANNTRRRRWNPNLKRVRAVVAGVRKQVRVCTACIRAGKIKKAA
jgi:large subunit ribosomal protein L28